MERVTYSCPPGITFRVPQVGYYTLRNKNLEGLGVKPHIFIKETAQDRMLGRDPQLEKAIEVIMKQVSASEKVNKKADAKKVVKKVVEKTTKK